MLRTRRQRVLVTGIGMRTPLGNRSDTWAGLCAGASGVSSVGDRFCWAERVGVAGLVETPGEARRRFLSKGHWAATDAASEAVADAGLGEEHRACSELIVGNNVTELDYAEKLAMFERASGRRDEAGPSRSYSPEFGFSWLRDDLGLAGVAPTLSTNCVAGVQAIYLGASWIAQGLADRVVAGGVDCAVTPEMAQRFLSLHALASPGDLTASRPFDARRRGFVLGDGACFLVLESERAREERGAPSYGEIRGWGLSNDAYHLTRGAPTPDRKLRAMNRALAVAGLEPADMVALNAHGTATPDNDVKEFQAWEALLGPRLNDVLITANKSALGHALAGAGAIEAGLSLLMLRHGIALPILNLDEPDKECEADGFVREPTPFLPGPLLKTTFAFGGLNACGVFCPAP